MTAPDDVLVRVAEAVAKGHAGDRRAARQQLAELWSVAEDPLHRCGIAHALADLQDDVAEELRWDLRALSSADEISDEQASAAGAGPVVGFYPSLHLNAGDCCRRLGDLDAAWSHVDRGLAAAESMTPSGYRELTVGGLERLAERLRAAAAPC